MRLILVRHAEPQALTVDGGRADPPLSPAGRRQAAAVAAALAAEGLDAVYASPLRRALETAARTADATAVPLTADEGLVELDSRSASYVPDHAADVNDARARAYLAGEWSILSDETPDAFCARVVACLDAIVARHRGQTVAVFTHGGVINAWLAAVVGAQRFPIRWYLSDYGAINRFLTTGADNTLIQSLNERVTFANAAVAREHA